MVRFGIVEGARLQGTAAVVGLIASALLACLPTPCFSKTILLSNGTVVNPAKRLSQVASLLIVDGKIAPVDTKRTPDEVIDLRGKWIIPGLIDTHVHFTGNPLPNGEYERFDVHACARRMLFCGVCAFVDLANGNFRSLFKERDLQRANPSKYSNEADICCVGTAFGRWNLPAGCDVGTVVKKYVSEFKPDVVKLIYGRDTLPKKDLIAAIHATNEIGIKTVVHIGTWEHAQDAIEAGASAVTHFFDDEVIPDSIADAWSKAGTTSIPTLAVQCDMAKFVDQPRLLRSPLLRSLESASALESFSHARKFTKKAKETLTWQRDDAKNEVASFHKLSHRGINILAGSDTGNIGTFQGFSLHREIKLMQDDGYSPWDALSAATTRAAKFLGRASGIEPGEVAELVILDADPIANIENTQRISAVVHHGVIVDRSKLLSPE